MPRIPLRKPGAFDGSYRPPGTFRLVLTVCGGGARVMGWAREPNNRRGVPAGNVAHANSREELKLDGKNALGQARSSKLIPKSSILDRYPRLFELFLCERAF